MDKSSRSNSASKVEVRVDPESIIPYNKVEVAKTVRIRSVLSARLEYTGLVTGKQYVWKSAGDIQPVDVEDSENLLAKRIGGNGCCGTSKDANRLFEIAD